VGLMTNPLDLVKTRLMTGVRKGGREGGREGILNGSGITVSPRFPSCFRPIHRRHSIPPFPPSLPPSLPPSSRLDAIHGFLRRGAKDVQDRRRGQCLHVWVQCPRAVAVAVHSDPFGRV